MNNQSKEGNLGRAARARRARAGISMIEVIVSLGLTGILMAAGGNILLQGVKSQLTHRQQVEADLNARAACDMIADDLKGAVEYNSTQNIGGQLKQVPSLTVMNCANGNTIEVNLANQDDWTKPLWFDIYSDSGSLRRVRYWRRFDSTLQCHVLRREIVNDSIFPAVGGVRMAAESASGPDAGRIVARNIERFTVQRPLDTSANASSLTRFDLVRITVQTLEGAPDAIARARQSRDYSGVSRSTAQTDVMLRNNAM